MNKIEKLKKDYMLDKSEIDNIRWLKEEQMGKLTRQEQKELKNVYEQMKENEKLLYKAIENLPEQFSGIKNNLDSYLENLEEINSYFQGKYFKEGVSFGINIILEVEK